MCRNKKLWSGDFVGATSAQDLLTVAYQKSDTASDTGSVAFTQHTAYQEAFRANREAWQAWNEVAIAAINEKNFDLAGDAKARKGELDVAYGMLKSDMLTTGSKKKITSDLRGMVRNAQLRKMRTPIPLGNSFQRGGASTPEGVAVATSEQSNTTKYGFLAAAALLGSKLLGLW